MRFMHFVFQRGWNICSISTNGIKVSDDQKLITKISQDGSAHNNNYGSNEIDSESECICQWDLKIIKSGLHEYGHIIYVGIASKQTPNTEVTNIAGGPGHYILRSDGRKRKSEDTKIEGGKHKTL